MKHIKFLKKLFFVTFLITGVLACNIIEDVFEDSKLSALLEGDDELIYAIANSTRKQSINLEQLPLNAKTTIETDYSSMKTENSYEIPKLGYEVNMRGVLPTNLGEKEDVFFAKNGRKLISKKNLRDGDKDKGEYDKEKRGKKAPPFEFVFPISFTMPDGTTISGEDHKEIRELMKEWYDANPDLKEKPELVFPVDVIIKSEDGEETITLSSKEEMEELRKRFKREKPKNRGPRKPKFPRTKD